MRWLCYNIIMIKKHDSVRKHTMPTVLRVLLSALFLFAMSIIFAWFIEVRRVSNDTDAAWSFVTSHHLLFWYSIVIIFFLLATLSAILWRPFLSTGIFFAVISAVMYAHLQKMKYREAPLLPEDFQMADQAGGLMQFIDPGEVIRLIFGIILVIIGSALLDHYMKKLIGNNYAGASWWQRYAIIPRASFTIIALVGLMLSTDFLLHRENWDDPDNPKVEWLDTEFTAWDQGYNYECNGFVLGFLYNLGLSRMEAPEGYSEEVIVKIAEKYEKIKEADTEREPLDQVADNIVIILDETFYDPELLSKYYAHDGGDPLPNLHALFKKYPSGYMYSPEYGGGTANVEFEVFSGLSNFWSGKLQYINSVPRITSLMSVASWAKKFGFDTDAIHAYDGLMYKRYIVYPKMGYDNFIDEDEIENPERENGIGYINDRTVYREILQLIEENSGKQMVGAVTMQNHAIYSSAGYTELDYSTNHPEISHSFQSLHYADQYLGEFLEALDRLDERTVVLWFGDHAAGVLSAYATSSDKAERDLVQLTPYFIYANFEIESPFTEKEVAEINRSLGFNFPTRGVDLPTTTPNCLANTMYNVLKAEKPVLQYLLDVVCEESPILARKYYAEDDDINETTALREYELLNYDILSGEYYWPYKK